MPIANLEARRKYQREWIAKRRADFFKDKECSTCSSKVDLVLHHIDPEEKETHNIWSWSLVRRLAEIAKCTVLCLYCHKEVHGYTVGGRCGTGYKYYELGCRCYLCKEVRHKQYLRTEKK